MYIYTCTYVYVYVCVTDCTCSVCICVCSRLHHKCKSMYAIYLCGGTIQCRAPLGGLQPLPCEGEAEDVGTLGDPVVEGSGLGRNVVDIDHTLLHTMYRERGVSVAGSSGEGAYMPCLCCNTAKCFHAYVQMYNRMYIPAELKFQSPSRLR